MAGRLQESYSGLEQKVEVRTRELGQSVAELRALGEVSQAVNSTLDLETVLNTIVTKAVQLSGTDAGAIYVFDESQKQFRLRSTYGMTDEMIAGIKEHRIGVGAALEQAAGQRALVQIPDLRAQPPSPVNDLILKAGYRALLVVPLLGRDATVGAL